VRPRRWARGGGHGGGRRKEFEQKEKDFKALRIAWGDGLQPLSNMLNVGGWYSGKGDGKRSHERVSREKEMSQGERKEAAKKLLPSWVN